MTPEIRRSQIKGFERLQKDIGGVTPSILDVGTNVYIETREYIYFLRVLDKDGFRVYDLETASPLTESGEVIAIQSHYPALKHDMDDWLGRSLRPVFKFTSGHSVMVGEVTGMTVEGVGADGEQYSFDLWRIDE